ncbi:hypothetical protein PIB30_070404 [Stylosanthes scabra]|uniref:Uncharacterized protein n=1 Tax=Stylosanthes scabra TaxID=79078 RepID=A0ABU6VQB9_9FABA|nr:hypothetical protein [Stylosanthes scabra]
MSHLIKLLPEPSDSFYPGGLFLHADTLPTSFVSFIPSSSSSSSEFSSNTATVSCFSRGPRRRVGFEIFRSEGIVPGGFLSLSLSINRSDVDQRYASRESSAEILVEEHHEKTVSSDSEKVAVEALEKENGSGAMNMTKHLWAGAVAAMVSRSSFL